MKRVVLLPGALCDANRVGSGRPDCNLTIHPYSLTSQRDRPWQGIDGKTTYTGEQLVGLNSVPYITRYFKDRNIDLGLFQPKDSQVSDLDGRKGKLRPKLMERGNEELLVYHPNAATDNKAARVDEAKTARMRIDLKNAPGPFQIEWFRAYDGVAQKTDMVEGGAEREFVAHGTARMSCFGCSND